MAFRLINNRAQQVAVIGFIVTFSLSVLLSFFNVPFYISMPFLLVWIMIWLLGSSSGNDKSDNTPPVE